MYALSRKHYMEIAMKLAIAREEVIDDEHQIVGFAIACEALAEWMLEDNPRFDATRFVNKINS